MTSLKPDRSRFGYIGDPGAAIAHEGNEHAHMVPLVGEQATTDLTGIIIDGQSAGDAANPARLFELLASGLTVAVAYPTPEILENLRSITGRAPATPVPLVSYSRLPQSNPAAYHMMVIGEGQQSQTLLSALASAEGPPPSTETRSIPISWNAVFASLKKTASPNVAAISQEAAGAAPRFAAFETGAQFLPPQGAVFGTRQSTHQVDAEFAGVWCDRLCQERGNPKQKIAAQFVNDFYVYWVDGGASPYYQVIAKQTTSINPTVSGWTDRKTLTWQGRSKGYFMYEAHSQWSLRAGRNATVTAYQPQSNATGSKQFQLQVPMMIGTSQSGGHISTPWTADSGQLTDNFPGWGLRDQSDLSQGQVYWRFHQMDGWNSIEKPREHFINWWGSMYYDKDSDHKDSVIDSFPDQSLSTLNFQVMCAWRIDCPEVTKSSDGRFHPPELRVIFSGFNSADVAQVHNKDGCSDGGGHHHIGWTWAWWPWDEVLQLEDIVRNT